MTIYSFQNGSNYDDSNSKPGSLSHLKLIDADWKTIIRYLHDHPDLTSLDLSHNQFQEIDKEFLEVISNHSNLIHVNLSENYIKKMETVTKTEIYTVGKQDWAEEYTREYKVREEVSHYLPISDIQKVNDILHAKKISIAKKDAFESKTNLGKLNNLELVDADWKKIIDYLNNHPELTELDLSHNQLQEIDDEFLRAVESHPELIKINLDDNYIVKRQRVKEEHTFTTGRKDWMEEYIEVTYVDKDVKCYLESSQIEKLKSLLKAKEEIIFKKIGKERNLVAAKAVVETSIPLIQDLIKQLKGRIIEKIELRELFNQINHHVLEINNISLDDLPNDVLKSLIQIKEDKEFQKLNKMVSIFGNTEKIKNVNDVANLLKKIDEVSSLRETTDKNLMTENFYHAVYTQMHDLMTKDLELKQDPKVNIDFKIERLIFLIRLANKYFSVFPQSSQRDQINQQILNIIGKEFQVTQSRIIKETGTDYDYLCTIKNLVDTYLNVLGDIKDQKLYQEVKLKLDENAAVLFSVKSYWYYGKIFEILKLKPEHNVALPKYYLTNSIAKDAGLSNVHKLNLLNQLEKVMSAEEKQHKEHIMSKTKIIKEYYVEKLKEYKNEKHAAINIERADQFIKIANKTDVSLTEIYTDILNILSSNHEKLKSIMLNSVADQFNVNLGQIPRNSKVDAIQAKIVNALKSENVTVESITINKKTIWVTESDSLALLREWKDLAYYAADLIYEKDFQGRLFFSADADPRKFLATSLPDLLAAVERLKGRCSTLVGSNPIADALNIISSGIVEMRLPKDDERLKIASVFKERENFKNSYNQLKQDYESIERKYASLRQDQALAKQISKIFELLKENGYGESQKACQQLIKTYPNATNLLWLSGMLYKQERNYGKAMAQFEKNMQHANSLEKDESMLQINAIMEIQKLAVAQEIAEKSIDLAIKGVYEKTGINAYKIDGKEKSLLVDTIKSILLREQVFPHDFKKEHIEYYADKIGLEMQKSNMFLVSLDQHVADVTLKPEWKNIDNIDGTVTEAVRYVKALIQLLSAPSAPKATIQPSAPNLTMSFMMPTPSAPPQEADFYKRHHKTKRTLRTRFDTLNYKEAWSNNERTKDTNYSDLYSPSKKEISELLQSTLGPTSSRSEYTDYVKFFVSEQNETSSKSPIMDEGQKEVSSTGEKIEKNEDAVSPEKSNTEDETSKNKVANNPSEKEELQAKNDNDGANVPTYDKTERRQSYLFPPVPTHEPVMPNKEPAKSDEKNTKKRIGPQKA